MKRTVQLLPLFLLLWTAPFAAQGQWATTQKVHDWRIFLGSHPYGVVEQIVYTTSLSFGTRTTTMYCGSFSWTSMRFRAIHFAGALLLLLFAVIVTVSMTTSLRTDR
jgi:hypothetical protein